MFDRETLLDSSPDRAPVLATVHWIISFALGAIGYLIWYFPVSLFLGRPEAKGALVVQSLVFGAAPLFITALMLCYVYADSRRMGWSVTLWMVVTVLFSIAGFLVYLIYSANKTKNWKRATMPIAYIIEAMIIGGMVLYPLIHTFGLPKAQLMTFLSMPPPPPPAPPPPPPAAPRIIIHRVSLKDLMKAPTVIPKKIVRIKDQPRQQYAGAGGVPGGVPGGTTGGVPGGILDSMGTAPPPPPKPVVPKVLRVGGQVEAARIIYQPMPPYPQLAKMARVQGEVRLSAVIGKDGTIQDLRLISGHPLLVPSAEAAVKQWRYEPYLLDGVPVVVDTEIDVNFTLSD